MEEEVWGCPKGGLGLCPPPILGGLRSPPQVHVQTATLTISMSLSASVPLGLLYAPKVYVILLHPERNQARTRPDPAP